MIEKHKWEIGKHYLAEIWNKSNQICARYGNATFVVNSLKPNKSFIEWKQYKLKR